MPPAVSQIPEELTSAATPVANVADSDGQPHRFRVADYAVILKPRVMSLVVFTALVGLLLAPGTVDPLTAMIAISCIAIGAGASGAINMWYDQDIDRAMRRTMNRPIPAGRMRPFEALIVGTVLSAVSVATMSWFVGSLAGALLAATILYYVFIYTIWLKRRTPQNIVIGGASGALPPVIGWVAVTGDIGLGAVVLFLIIFLWTPPHSWALALYRNADYIAAGVPMMPVVAGERQTKKMMLIYTALLIPATLLPVAIGLSGGIYLAAASVLGGLFGRHAYKVWRDETTASARPMFLFSILYLFLIFVSLVVDRAFFIPI